MKKFTLNFKQDDTKTTLSYSAQENQIGLLNKVATVIFANGWDGLSAQARVDENHKASGELEIEHVLGEPFNQELCEKISNEIIMLLDKEKSCIEYLETTFAGLKIFSHDTFKVSLVKDLAGPTSLIQIKTENSPGVLIKMTYQLDALDINIHSFKVETDVDTVTSSFVISWKDGAEIGSDDLEFLETLLNKKLGQE